MKEFNWDAIPVTITAADTQTSAGAAVEKLYTCPAGKRWLIIAWRATCSTNAKAFTARLYKEAAKTNLIEEWLSTSTHPTNYSSRGLNVANNSGWSDIEVPAGATIAFNYTSDGAGQTLITEVEYKEAPA